MSTEPKPIYMAGKVRKIRQYLSKAQRIREEALSGLQQAQANFDLADAKCKELEAELKDATREIDAPFRTGASYRE